MPMHKRIVFILVVLMIFCTGCAGVPIGQTEMLTERVNQYWGLLLKRDFEKSYMYEAPEYRQEVGIVDYARSFGAGVNWLGARVDKIEEKGNEAVVYVAIRYVWNAMMHMPKDGIESIIAEKWSFVEGAWYHQRSKISDPTSTPKGGGN